MQKSKAWSVVFCVLPIVVGCNPAPQGEPTVPRGAAPTVKAQSRALELARTEWVVTEIQGDPVASEVRSTMAFDDEGKVTGSAGCNRYFGAYSVDGDSISFGHLAATQMMCPPEQMEQESRFLEVLGRAERFEESGGALVLSFADGGETMVLSRVEPSPLVTGSVLYRERIALPPEATLTVRLVDVSRMDAPAVLLGEQVVTPTGQVPIPFEISYDPAQIDERMSYAVQARIEVGGQLMFISTQAYPVITRGNPSRDLEILVERADGS